MHKIFIDGSAGTTGLRIYDRLRKRDNTELITLSEERRKDPKARREAINSADAVFLCLPDEAAREAVSFVENPDTVVIDASTAHRTQSDWAYGFPELSVEHFQKIKTSKRIAVPGCHASGFIALAFPLVQKGILTPAARLSCHSITGYSGGGKKMIAEYEGEDVDRLLLAPRQYGIAQKHKHLNEMKNITGLENYPLFCPIVSNFYSGMEVTIPLFAADLSPNCTLSDIKAVYREKYTGGVVRYAENCDEGGFLSAGAYSGKDSMEISVHGNEERILLVARYDNLEKGASGAALECFNIAFGYEPEKDLEL